MTQWMIVPRQPSTSEKAASNAGSGRAFTSPESNTGTLNASSP